MVGIIMLDMEKDVVIKSFEIAGKFHSHRNASEKSEL